jgi:hypothetical protein
VLISVCGFFAFAAVDASLATVMGSLAAPVQLLLEFLCGEVFDFHTILYARALEKLTGDCAIRI